MATSPVTPSAPPRSMTSSQYGPPSSSIEEMVTCPICMERMRSPKHLNCQHAFCAPCLEDWTQQPGNSRTSISCPVCRNSTPIKNGVYNLPNDIGVTRLLDVLEQQQQSSTPQGHLCANDGAPAAVFCNSCGHYLCQNCVEQHIQNQNLWPHLLHLDGINCPQHASRVQNLHCQQCNIIGCSACMQELHTRHSVTDLNEVARANRTALGYLLQSLKDRAATARCQPDMVSVFALESKLEELRHQVDVQANKNQLAIDAWKKAILAQIKRRGDQLVNEVSGVEAQVEVSETLRAFVERFLEEGTDYQIVSAFSSTSQRIQKTTDSIDSITKRQRTGDYDMFVSPEPTLQTCGKLLNPFEDFRDSSTERTLDSGQHRERRSFQSTSSQTTSMENVSVPTSCSSRTPTQPRIENWHTSSKHQRVSRSIEFDVLTWENNGVVMQRDLHSGPDKNRSHVAKQFVQWFKGEKDEDVEAPVTVFLCNKTGYLFVGKAGWWTPGYVIRYNSCKDVIGVRNVMTNIFPKAVAVSPVDGTIVCCLGDSIAYHKKGEIPATSYDESVSAQKMTLPTIRCPYGIAISCDDRWVVVDQVNCLIGIYKYSSEDSHVSHLATFGCSGDGPREFHNPTYVCCDPCRDQFIVADTGNNRIQVFNMSGDYLWESDGSESGRALSKPRGLCVDGQGNILVADAGNKRIAVLGWEKGDFLKEIKFDFMPYSISLDGRGRNKAGLVLGGLAGKMPVVKTIEFVSSPSLGWVYL